MTANSVWMTAVVFLVALLVHSCEKSGEAKNASLALSRTVSEAKLVRLGEKAYAGELSEPLEEGTEAVLVSFWASWCLECLREVDLLNELKSELEGRLLIVGVASLDEESQVQKSLFYQKADFPLLYDSDWLLARQYSVEQLPQTFMFDAQGNFLRHFKGVLGSREISEIKEFF